MVPLKEKNPAVYLADDHPFLLDGIDFTLSEASFEIIGRAATYSKASSDLASCALSVDLLICDVSFPDGNGLELVRTGKKKNPVMKAIVFTAFTGYLKRALAAGADGYVLKNEEAESLLTAARVIMQGNKYLSPAVTNQVIQLFEQDDAGQDFRNAIQLLNERERAILPHLHMENAVIADLLSIPLRTVEGNIDSIRKKLGLTRPRIIRQYARAFPIDDKP